MIEAYSSLRRRYVKYALHHHSLLVQFNWEKKEIKLIIQYFSVESLDKLERLYNYNQILKFLIFSFIMYTKIVFIHQIN